MPINCQLTNIDYQEYFFGKENLLLYFVPTYQTQLAPWKKKNADKFQWFLYEYVSILALILASPALKYKKHLAVNKYLSVLPLSPALKDTPYAQNFCSWLWKTIVEQWHFWTIHCIPIILLSLLKVQELTF